MPIIKNFQQLFKGSNAPLKGLVNGNGIKTPNIQSDYVIAIMPNYSENTNAEDYEGVIATSIDTSVLGNGFSMKVGTFGLTAADMNFPNKFPLTYIGTKYSRRIKTHNIKNVVNSDEENNLTVHHTEFDTVDEGVYPSLIHYYYQQQISEYGTLRIKTKYWSLPAVYIYNLRTEQPIFVMKNCYFTMPTFAANPSSNDIIQYKTTIFYNSYTDLQNQEATFEVNKESSLFGVTRKDDGYDSYLNDVSGTEDYRWNL